jgi:chitodextrinase
VSVTTQAVASQAPVGWWNFDETFGSTAADSSGNNHSGGLINNPTWTTGKVGGAISFNGTTNYVDFGDNLDLVGNDLSLSIWVKPNTLTDYMAFIDKLSSGGNYRLHGAANGSVAYGIRNTASGFDYISSAAGVLRVGIWTHIAVVHTNATNQGTLYINGVAVGTKTFAITRGDTTDHLKSGYTANNSRYYNGAVDDMRIYNRVLSAAEVQALYNIAPPPDITPPTTPTNLAGTAISSSQINLTWTASTDNVAVTGYKIFRNGTQVGTSPTNSYSDLGLAASTVYTYTVSAYDAAGNNSAQSPSASVITLGSTAPSIAIGRRVTTTANLNVRQSASPSATRLGTESSGSLGTVAGGPTTAGGHTWWQINYDNGINGWSIADYLGVVSAASSPAIGMTDPLPSIASTQPYTSLAHQLSNKSKI